MIDDDKLSSVLSEFARTMVTDFPIQRILDHLIRRIVEVLPVTSAGVTLISSGMAPRYVAASDESALRYERLQTDIGEGPCLVAFRSGEAVEVRDLATDTRFPSFASAAMAAGLAAVFTFPLRHGDGRLGALDLYRDTAGPLDPNDLAAAQTLADVVAAYLINAQARDNAMQVSDRFHHDAFHDPLTGLPNRALLLERLEHAGLRAGREDAYTAMLFVDIDRFKVVNDTYGHHTGDQLLIEIAGRLSALVRRGDTLARFSGDEFVFLCEHLRGAGDGEALAARVRATFARPFLLGQITLTVTASVGLATTGPNDAVSDELLVRADREMYVHKRSLAPVGELPFGPWTADRMDRNRRQGGTDLQLEHELRAALEADELELAYQPIVGLPDGRIVGVEALLRWCSRVHGPVPPDRIIEIAERTELIGALGSWVLRRACEDHAGWCRAHPGLALDLDVNVSPRQVVDPTLLDSVTDIVTAMGMAPERLVLELTETLFIADTERTVTALQAIVSSGVRLALDDFGAGWSSLRHLDRFPLQILKIDRHFVSRLTDPASNVTLLAGITSVAHDLGLIVTVEGIETGVQHDHVVAIGCDRGQGHHYGRPVTAAIFGRSLDAVALGSHIAVGT